MIEELKLGLIDTLMNEIDGLRGGGGVELLLRELWRPGVLQGKEGGFDDSEEFGKRGH